MATGADGRGGGEEGARVIDLFYSFFHPVLAFFFSKMSIGVDGDCSERGCSISDIFFYLSTPFFLFILLFKNGHFTSLLLPLPYFFFTFQKWPLVQMVVMGKGDAALMILETAEEAEPQTEERAHQNPSCLLYKLYIYAQIMCLNCVPTRTHHVSCHSLACSPAFGHSFH